METYVLYAVAMILLVISLVKDRRKTVLALKKGLKAFEGILPQFLVVMIIVGVVLAIFNPETISRLVGERSGVLGVIAAAAVGSITLIPGFVAFPAAAELLRNGAGVVQIAAFVSSLMMVGVVTLPMEMKFFGRTAAIARNALALVFSFLAAIFVGWMVSL